MCTVLDEAEVKGGIKATVIEAQYYHASYNDTVKRVAEKYNLSEKEAEERVKLYWSH